MGPIVSEEHIVLQLDGNLFVGDMIANKFHSWLELAKTDEVVESLKYLQTLQLQKIYPGRGSLKTKISEQEKEYITFFVNAAKKHHDKTKLLNQNLQRLKTT